MQVKFLNCLIDLSKGVFKPRPETKFWVKKVIQEIKKQKEKLKVLDIFSGSGCIGIAILKNKKNTVCDFADIDEKAIAQIKINLKLNSISPKRYQVYQSNLFEKLKGKKYDLILANPPYVAKERLWQVQESVKKSEPKISWYGGKGGMRWIKKFLKEAKKFLNPKGKIFMEFDPLQMPEIEKILKKEKYSDFKFCKDNYHKYRWVKIQN